MWCCWFKDHTLSSNILDESAWTLESGRVIWIPSFPLTSCVISGALNHLEPWIPSLWNGHIHTYLTFWVDYIDTIYKYRGWYPAHYGHSVNGEYYHHGNFLTIFFLFLFSFLLLFQCSCLHFPGTTFTHPPTLTSHPQSYPPLALSMGPLFYMSPQ